MVDKNNVDKHRYSLPGVKGRVVESEKWGRATARERYGSPQHYRGAPNPKDESGSQFRESQRADKGYNDTSGWVRAEGETAEKRPGYVGGYKGKSR
jgi:hypothetical protein